MTYPQPSGSDYVVDNQNAFRLTTNVVGPGDIYESDASGLALAIGPLSDIANVAVTYLDDQRTPALVNSMVISPERSYVGRIDARMDTVYPLSLRPGRVLFSLADLYDPNFRPTGFSPGDDAIQFLDPVLDIVQYFQEVPSIVPARADRELYLRYLDVPAGDTGWVMIPAWGRKYGHFSFFNPDVTPTTVSVIGVRFSMTADADAHYQEGLYPATAINGSTGDDFVWNAADQGVFDMIGISSSSAGPMDMRITLSDKPAGCCPPPAAVMV